MSVCHRQALSLVSLALVVLYSGCDQKAKTCQNQVAQMQAQHARELQFTQQAAAATATSRTMQSMQTKTEQSMQKGIEVGKALGRSEAMTDLERREAQAKKDGFDSGKLAGDKEGYGRGREDGEKLGYAEASTIERQKGFKSGETFGQFKGRDEMWKETREEVDQVATKHEEIGRKIGLTEGEKIGREYQRTLSFQSVLAVALSTCSLFAAMLFFMWTRREPGSVKKTVLQHQEQCQHYEKLFERMLSCVESKQQIEAENAQRSEHQSPTLKTVVGG